MRIPRGYYPTWPKQHLLKREPQQGFSLSLDPVVLVASRGRLLCTDVLGHTCRNQAAPWREHDSYGFKRVSAAVLIRIDSAQA